MNRGSGTFTMFYGPQARDFLVEKKHEVQRVIDQIPENEILNANEAEYIDKLARKYTAENPLIDFDNIYTSTYERLIPSEQFPPDIFTRPGKSYPKSIIVFHLPFKGNAELFHHTPSQYILLFPEVFIEDNSVCFEIVKFRDDMELIKAEADRNIKIIRDFSEALTRDVEAYGIKRTNIQQIFLARKEKLLKSNETLTSLGFPVRILQTRRSQSEASKVDNHHEKKKGSSYDYDVALSFAGEDREYAEALALILRNRGVRTFYDEFEKATLWGKNLYTYLSDLYQNKARYCVMLLSKYYAAKLWTNHEREAAQARAFKDHEEYILPICLDNTAIPGMLPTIAYLSWPPETVETITDIIMAKLA